MLRVQKFSGDRREPGKERLAFRAIVYNSSELQQQQEIKDYTGRKGDLRRPGSNRRNESE